MATCSRIAKSEAENCMFMKVEYIFGKALLQEDTDTNMIQESLAAVYEQCVGRFWGLPNNGETIYSKVQPREPVPT